MTLILSNIKVCELLLFFPQALLASNYGYMITISNNEEKIYTQISNMKIRHPRIAIYMYWGAGPSGASGS